MSLESLASLAHRRYPKLFNVGEPQTEFQLYPSEWLCDCVALDPVTHMPSVVSSGHSLHANPELRNYFELLQQVDKKHEIIPDHYVAAVCAPLPQPSLQNPNPRPSNAKHFSCYFPPEYLNPCFIFHGKYAGAFRAVMATTQASVVIKRIDMRRLKSLRSNFSKLVTREKMLLQRLSNARIPRMIRQYVDPLDGEFVYFVLEDGGSSNLMNLLRSSMSSCTVLAPSIIKKIMIDVFSALSYLHHNNIVHRDIKSDNIAVSSHVLGVGGLTADNVVAQIIDFGMGRVLIEEELDPDPEEIQQHEQESLEYKRTSGFDDCEPEPDSPVGLADEPLYRRCTSSESSPMYSAPEICLTRGNYNTKVDVFAAGCLLAELLFCCNSDNFRHPQDGEYLKRRWLFPSRMQGDQTKLPKFQQILPVLKHSVFDPDDIQHPHPHRALLTKKACDRLVDERHTGFDKDAMQRCSMEMFDYQDLAERYADPGNLDPEELVIFAQLRTVLKGCLVFDPSRRLSSHNALETLTGRLHHYESMPVQALEHIKCVELAVQHMDPQSLERQRMFIKHSSLDGQPTPVSMLFKSAP